MSTYVYTWNVISFQNEMCDQYDTYPNDYKVYDALLNSKT
jgi:hypothetical protein